MEKPDHPAEPPADQPATHHRTGTRLLTPIQSGGWLAGVVESAMDAIVAVDSAQRIIIFNPAAERMFGCAAADAVGTPISRFIPEQFRSAHREQVERFRASGTTSRKMGALGEVAALRANGDEFWAEAAISRAQRDGETLLVVVLRDIAERKRGEDALRASEERYRRLVQLSKDAIFHVDASGAVLFASPSCEAVFGYRSEEFVADPALTARIVHPDYRSQFDSFWRCYREQGVFPQDWREWGWVRRDGRTVYTENLFTPILDSQGCATGFETMARDITERKQAEDALRESEARFRTLVEQSPFSTQIFRPDGTTLSVNGAFCALWGATPEAAQHVIRNYNILKDEQLEAAGLMPYIRRGFGGEFAEIPAIRYDPSKTRIVSRTGLKEAWVLGFIYPVKDLRGEVSQVVLMHEDISERKQAEDALRASEEKYRSFFEQDLAGNYVSTAEGRLLACNTSFARMFGFASVEEAMQASLASLYPSPAAREEFLALLAKHGRVEHRQVELQRRDGTKLYAIETAIAAHDQAGRLTEIRGHVIDESERRRAAQHLRQAQKMEAVGQLAGGVAHDFNNLLSVILGYADLLERGMSPHDPLRAKVDEILKAGERAAGLTRQLLAFSRRQVQQPRILDLNALVDGLSAMLRRLLEEDIELTFVPARDLGQVRADPGQMEQVLMNLTVNARDAMPQGGQLTIETANVELDEAYVSTHPGSRAGRHVALSVSDTGHGMDAELQRHVFEPFFTTKEVGVGTGLGLATVYGIVKQSYGYIAVYSEPGHGATFRVFLPRVDEQADVELPVSEGPLPGGSETILLVEDEESLRHLAREVLESLGYKVIEAKSGAVALDLATGHAGPIDLVLTDVVMPLMSGLDLWERLAPSLPLATVLFMSGHPRHAVARRLATEGAAFLQKPLTPKALAAKVRAVLDARPR